MCANELAGGGYLTDLAVDDAITVAVLLLLLGTAPTAIPAFSAAVGTDSCALQARTCSGGMQWSAGGREGSANPDCTTAPLAPFGMRTDLCVPCRCALQVAGQ
jgi:hypothetical protein